MRLAREIMVRGFGMILWTICVVSGNWCDPDEDLAKCVERQQKSEEIEKEVEVRGYSSYQRSCRAQGGGYKGACDYPSGCHGRSYSYSTNCGLGGLVCCKGKPVSDQKFITHEPPLTTTSRTVRPTKQFKPAKASTPRSLIDYKNEECGVSGPVGLIYGGVKADEGEFPFMVSLVTQRGLSFCGGVLITRRHVLTAAHCFDNKDWSAVEVRIGQTDLREEEEGTMAYIRNVKIHEKYSKKGVYPSKRLTPLHDIALITLDRLVTSLSVSAVCLPNARRAAGQAMIAGWGQTTKAKYGTSVRELRKAKVDTFPPRTCQSKYTDFVKSAELVRVTEAMMCAGNQNADTCAGDSGGPLLYNEIWTELRWTVYGIVSFGPTTCAHQDLPGVYTKVEKYLDWIDKNIEV